METLPPELQIQVCSYLPRADQLTITRTCTSLAAAAKPLLFETLSFHGDDHTSETHMHLRGPCLVELASLESAVDKVRALGITKYVKTFQYSPKIYVEGMLALFIIIKYPLTRVCRVLVRLSRLGRRPAE